MGGWLAGGGGGGGDGGASLSKDLSEQLPFYSPQAS